MNWLHKLLNPHCTHCIEDRICKSCEFLRFELEKSQRLNEQLLAKLLQGPVKESETVITEELQPIIPRTSQGWRVRRAEMEAESRKLAQKILEDKNKELEEIVLGEKEDAS